MPPLPDRNPEVADRIDLGRAGSLWRWYPQTGPMASGQFPDAAQWADIPVLGTVAHVLRSMGRWSWDETSLDMDTGVWWFSSQFDHPSDPLDAGEQWLVLNGLAGQCEVWLNGESILVSDNMFVRHEVLVSGKLKATANVLMLRFDALTPSLGLKRPRPRWRTPMVAHQQLRWFRTTLLGRTPGWSVPAPPIGPWRPLELLSRHAGQLIDARVVATLDGEDGLLTIQCHFQDQRPQSDRIELLMEGPDGTLTFAVPPGVAGLVELTVRIPGVALWWPHTHGHPTRYAVSLRWSEIDGTLHHVQLRTVGFRTIAQVPDQPGFALRVNGTSVFCRGACWMPLDVVSLQADHQSYRQALVQARDAGMNMLRVPGSTVYEAPVFHDLCDELGIMVWQDLMFANMDYPFEDAAFAASCQAEVRQQLARLTQHPSLAVVCGNSEVEQQAAMWGASKPLWQQDFFHVLLPQILASVSADTVYWPSSAHGGDFPHQPKAGTCSYYGVGAYKRDVSDGLASGVSFATECLALANIPPASTLRRSPAGEHPQVHSPAWKSRVYRDLSVGWDFDDVREHYVERMLGVRPDELRATDPAHHLALGRAVSAEVMARTMAAWRTADSRCAGALVWFLRDLWPGAGCGLVDDQGVPKSVLHALSRVQQPLLAVVQDDGLNGLRVHLVNETAAPVPGVVEVVLYQHGETVLARKTLPLCVKARRSESWPLTDWLDAFMDLNWCYRFGPRAVDLVVINWVRDSGERVYQASHFDSRQLINFQGSPGLNAVAVQTEHGALQVSVSSRAVAYGVHFETFGWQASEEFFHLMPGETHTVYFKPVADTTPVWFGTVKALNARGATPIALAKKAD